jgi:hypothetical protein
MDSASKLLNELPSLERLESIHQKLQRCWKSAVGAKIASHSRVVQLRGRTVEVAVDDTVWKSQLDQLQQQILDRIRSASGIAEIERVSFRVSPPRIKPQVAQAPLFGADEADRIADPLLRRIYKNSRRKAQA